MKILQIAPQVPYPLIDGGKIGIFNIMKYVARRGNKVDFAAYCSDDNVLRYRDMFEQFCCFNFIQHNTKNNLLGLVKNIFSRVPYNFEKYQSRAMKQFLLEYFRNNDVDVVHVDHAHMAWVVDVIRPLTKAKIVLREHNFELKIMRRFYRGQKNIIIKLFAYLQYKKMLHYEPAMCGKFDGCIMISEQDEVELLKLNPSVKTTIIPVGIEDELLQMQDEVKENHSISHLGSLEWAPNRDGLMWFIDKVFPEVVKNIPDVKLYLIGKHTEHIKVPAELQRNVIGLGFVEDALKRVRQTQLTIIPLHVGGGIRVKIFELMGIGQLIISTSVGKEGISVNDKEHLFIEDDPHKFASRIIDCLQNFNTTKEITQKAKSLMRDKYSWNTIAGMFEQAYRM
jgi:glycosyltransferase involved in cell wall biosynthesis